MESAVPKTKRSDTGLQSEYDRSDIAVCDSNRR